MSTSAFSKCAATLGNVEENDSVSRALARLAEVEEKVEALHEEQVSSFCHIQFRPPWLKLATLIINPNP